MAVLTITEVSHVGYDGSSAPVLAPMMPPVVEQSIAITGASTTSAPFNSLTRFVLIHCDVACALAFGAAPTAAAGTHEMSANETRFYAVTAGLVVAVISG